MYKITDEEKKQFQTLGYLAIPMPIDKSLISEALIGAKSMRSNAINERYPLARTYYDHISNWNLAAIEAPFNKFILDERVKVLLKNLKLGSAVKSLMEWDDTYCSLARLFTMGDYKYRGNWHRDNPITEIETPSKCTNVVQIELYLEDQYGFRFLKKDYDIGGGRSIIKNLDESTLIQNFGFPLSPQKESFDVLGGPAGTILFFNPTRFHQGSTDGSRIDFHLRFERISNDEVIHNQLTQNYFLDFKCINYLDIDASINDILSNKTLPAQYRSSFTKRLVNSINYKTSIYNLLRICKAKISKRGQPDGWKHDFLSNTIFQS